MAEHSGNKYHRRIIGLDGITTYVDVYRVLDAFNVTDPGLQHAIKKLLCAGIRGKGDTKQDLSEAQDAIEASKLMLTHKAIKCPACESANLKEIGLCPTGGNVTYLCNDCDNHFD